MQNYSTKSRLVALLLVLLLGSLGVHRFYVGKIGTGILQILSWIVFPVLFVWVWVDIIMIVCGKFKDSKGLYVKYWND